jgi:MFS family permease
MPAAPGAQRPSLRGIGEGIRYALSRQELIGTYTVDMVAMFFGMPMALFPALADRLGGPSVLGLLYAAPAVGSLVASATSGWAARVHRHGLAIVVAASGWGLAIAAFGLAPSVPLALLFLGLAGAADMISGVFRQAVWNQTIPDRIRGRLAGIEVISYSTGPALSGLESGVVATLFSPIVSVVTGGVACVVGAVLLAAALPGFFRYDNRTPPAAIAQ